MNQPTLAPATPRNGRSALALLGATALIAALLTVAASTPAAAVPTPVINAPQTDPNVGYWTSLQLDGDRFPVISYRDDTNSSLKLMHCNDVACAGNDESITTPDGGASFSPADTGNFGTSLQLDSSGNPVVAYYELVNDNGASTADLKILHCDDPNCDEGGDSITSPDTIGNVGKYPSLQLDSKGYPVVSYFDETNGTLRILHCNDADCAGGDETVETPDTDARGVVVGKFTSLQLDRDRPVVAYHLDDSFNGRLKILHCNDLNCAGRDESIEPLDAGGNVGSHTSLQINGEGHPVISYLFGDTEDLKLVSCNDVNCAGGNDIPVTVDSAARVGYHTSLALDPATGTPVVAYLDIQNVDLKVLSYTDPDAPPTATAGLTAQVTIGPSPEVCVTLDTVEVDFGTLPFGTTGAAGPTIVTNCGDEDIDLSGEVSRATLAGTPVWTPTADTNVCAVGTNRFAYGLTNAGITTQLSDIMTILTAPAAPLAPSTTRADAHTLTMPCAGSTGAPDDIVTMNVLFTATPATP